MKVKQIDKTRLEAVEVISADTIRKTYVPIDSEIGRELIKEHNIVIDENMEEF